MADRIYLASPNLCGNEQAYVQEAFDSNWVTTMGPFVSKLEDSTKSYVGVEAACAMSSGTSALHLALKLAGVQQGDYVFCSSLTFSASANPIMYEKAIPVFIDSEPGSYNMSPKALARAFEQYSPRAVIVVDLYGQSADMDPILKICKAKGVPIIEDAAEALGASYKGKKCGSFGEYNILSFNGNKIITGSTGGMLLTKSKAAAEKALYWATQAREPARNYQHTEVGYNYRLSNVCAAIACGQLECLAQKIDAKKHIYDTYADAFKNTKSITMFDICEYGQANYWLSCAHIDPSSPIKPLDIMIALEKQNIEARPIWKPLHMQPVFMEFPFFKHDDSSPISVAEQIYNEGICLPSDINMTDKDQAGIIRIIQKLFKGSE